MQNRTKHSWLDWFNFCYIIFTKVDENQDFPFAILCPFNIYVGENFFSLQLHCLTFWLLLLVHLAWKANESKWIEVESSRLRPPSHFVVVVVCSEKCFLEVHHIKKHHHQTYQKCLPFSGNWDTAVRLLSCYLQPMIDGREEMQQ